MTPLHSAREVLIPAGGVRLRAEIDPPWGGDDEAFKRSAVVVLHGFTGSAESMECVVEAIAGTRGVIRLELVGHGGSAMPSDPERYSMSSCVDQIQEAVAWLAGTLGYLRPHLLGYSMGGRAALATAIAHPESFASLCLVGATAGIADASLRAERIAADNALAESILRDGLAAFVDRWMALPLFASQASLGAEWLERARAQRLRNRPEALAASLRGMGAGAQLPLHDQLEGIQCPALLVVGERDAKFRAIAQQLQGDLSRAEIAVVSGVGHAAHLEDVVAFGRRVKSFFGRVDSEVTGSDLSEGALCEAARGGPPSERGGADA